MATDNRRKRSTHHRKESDIAKKSLIEKVNTQPKERKISSQRPSKIAKSSLASKVNSSPKSDATRYYKDSATKNNSTSNTSNSNNASQAKTTNKKEKKAKKPVNTNSKFRKSFFFKLSKVGRVMLVIYLIGVLFLGFQLIKAAMNKGKIIYGSRPVPTYVVSAEQVSQVKDSLTKNITGVDNIMVDYRAYRFVVVVDMKDSATVDQAKKINSKAYELINKIIPIKEYFTNSKDGLTNDLYIYSTDKVPTDYKTTSKFIYETYKNSAMSKSASYNLTTPRDADSAKEVIKTLK
ncbi:MAG: hypothetical protein LBR40_02175 [Bacilli bacterium]|nr:hypothetical protein [Bacilli bacterium]